ADSADEFTRVDLNFHYRMTILSGNPIFTLILNGFGELYQSTGLRYFSLNQARDHSRSFYKKLLSSVMANDVFQAQEVTRQVMAESIDLWHLAEKNSENEIRS